MHRIWEEGEEGLGARQVLLQIGEALRARECRGVPETPSKEET